MIFDLFAFTQSLPVNASFQIQNCFGRGLEPVSRWTCHTTSQLCRATGPLNSALLLFQRMLLLSLNIKSVGMRHRLSARHGHLLQISIKIIY